MTTIAAVLTIESAVWFLFVLIIVGIIFGILWWLANNVGLPAIFQKVANVALMVLGAFVLIGMLLSLIGHPIIRF